MSRHLAHYNHEDVQLQMYDYVGHVSTFTVGLSSQTVIISVSQWSLLPPSISHGCSSLMSKPNSAAAALHKNLRYSVAMEITREG